MRRKVKKALLWTGCATVFCLFAFMLPSCLGARHGLRSTRTWVVGPYIWVLDKDECSFPTMPAEAIALAGEALWRFELVDGGTVPEFPDVQDFFMEKRNADCWRVTARLSDTKNFYHIYINRNRTPDAPCEVKVYYLK